MRPSTLAEVAALAAGGEAEDLAFACDEFCDSFYLDYPDAERMQAHIDPEPAILGHPERDAWIGAIGEHLALRWRLKVPAWTARAGHFALTKPVFMPPSKALRTLLLAEMAEPLERARFPRDVERVRMPWDDRASRPALLRREPTL